MRAGLAWAAVCTSVLAVACGPTRRTPPPSADIDEDAYRIQLSTLASAEFQGRRPGTDGEARTVAYLVAEFRRLNLKPISGDSYLQSVPMIEFTAEAPASLSLSGPGPTIALGAGRNMVLWSSQDRAQVSLQGSELVFAGYGVVAAEYGRDDYAALDVHGKTVVVLSGDPGPPAEQPPPFKTHLQGYYG